MRKIVLVVLLIVVSAVAATVGKSTLLNDDNLMVILARWAPIITFVTGGIFTFIKNFKKQDSSLGYFTLAAPGIAIGLLIGYFALYFLGVNDSDGNFVSGYTIFQDYWSNREIK